MASRAILSNLFEEQRTQNHPQYLSGLSRAKFFDPTTLLEIAVSEAGITQFSLEIYIYKSLPEQKYAIALLLYSSAFKSSSLQFTLIPSV